jgi:Arc/MetJ-type ribon-helix-helix transcriptional regulator
MIYRGISLNHQSGSSSGEAKMKLITLYLPETYIKALDQLVDERFYPNRAEAIRVAIRDLISAEVWRRNAVD